MKLTAGAWELVWGTLDPQNLSTQRVIIFSDATDGEVDITLPPTSDPKTKEVQLYIINTSDTTNKSYAYPADGDTLRGETGRISVFNGYGKGSGIWLLNLYDSNWNGGNM